MKNFSLFFAMFALVLGVIFSGCAMNVSDDSSSTDNEGYYEIYSRDGDAIDDDFLGKEDLSDSGKITLSVKAPEGATVRYLTSNTNVTSDYPSASNAGNVIKFLDSSAKTISNISNKYVLFAYCSGRFNWSEATLGYWEVENYSVSTTKLAVTFAQSGTSLTISATSGSTVVSSAIVRYTIDGTDPTSSSPLNITGSQTITVSYGLTVKAKAFATGTYTDSDVNTYVMSGSNPTTPATGKYFYIDTSYSGKSVKIVFEDGSGTSGTYTIGSDGKIPVVVSGTPKLSVNIIVDGSWRDAAGNTNAYSQCQSSDWSGDSVKFTSYSNGGFVPTGTVTTWTRK